MPYNKEKTRSEYFKRKAAGDCVAFGCHNSARPGKVLCDYHGKEYTKRKDRYRKKHPGQRSASDKRTRQKRKDSGRCASCGLKLDPDADEMYVQCMNCREHLHRERMVI